MTVNIKMKHIIAGAVIIIAAVLAIMGVEAQKNSTYMEQAKICQKDIRSLYNLSSMAASSLQNTWYGYVYENKIIIDRNTGLFYRLWGLPEDADDRICYNLNQAITEEIDFLKKVGFNVRADSLYTSVKQLMTQMTPPPRKYSGIHSDINALFHAAEAMYNCVPPPVSDLNSYAEKISTLSAEYKRLESQVDIEIGEVEDDGYDD